MATQVRETSAGKSVSAYIVLNKKGQHVATVNAHYANSGRVTVDVMNTGTGTTERCLAAALKSGYVTPAQMETRKAALLAKYDWIKADDVAGYVAGDLFNLQQGSAGGGGYDKFTACLSGMWVDGVQLTDHCGRDAASEKLLKRYIRAMANHKLAGVGAEFVKASQKAFERDAAKIGARFANFSTDRGAYTSLHVIAGLERLEKLGYRVISAI